MKENSSTRLKHSIQKKLMAATSMLMVAVIMMVSSTYAWFTLSTAPEVTGITTAVGANGNLEIALAYVDASKNINTWTNPEQISSAVGTSGDNTSWGNLIDVEDNAIYGLDKITLLPAELNVTKTDEMAMVNTSSYLSTPVYGADGRVSALSPNSAVTGVYNATEEAFYVNDAMKGVRAIGTASAMTVRQTDYRNAKASLTSNGTLAQISASNSLYNNGSDLANIILKHATANAATEKYSAEEVATVQNVITSLNTAVQKIGIALEDAMKGYVASAAVQNAATGAIDDATYELIKGSLTLANVQGTTGEGGVVTYTITVGSTSYTLPATWSTAYEIYTGSVADLASAQTAVNACPTDGEATWTQISEALRYLVDTNKVNVNGYTADEVKDNMSALVNAVASGGVKVQLPNNSGVYSDIAALTGDYTTSITIKEVTYNNLTLENLNATMSTVVIGNGTDQVSTPYFTVLSTEIGVAGAPAAGAADADTKITDFYGYAIDMLFRTNASSSDLLLQTSAVDRIYSDNTANEETMGGGSTMTFKTLDAATFSTNQVAQLMNAIRVVFMDDTGKILANARLDMGETTANGATTKNYVITGESVTADLLIWNEETTVIEGEKNTIVTTNASEADVNGETYKDTETTDPTTGVVTKVNYTSTLNADSNPATYTVTSTTTKTTPGSFQTKDKGVITSLNQNEAMNVTVLVYLDGNYVDNTMVAATTTQSMTGTMNLQFASSATLVPMSNTALEQGNTSTNTSESGSTTTP